MTDLMELASRVEAGEGPDAMLDLAIFQAVTGKEGIVRYMGREGISAEVPAYTASLDAVMSLVPEEAFWKIENHPMYGFCGTVDDEQAFACTGPLTLAAAALRAIACRRESHDEQ